jgi:hypothetical protein
MNNTEKQIEQIDALTKEQTDAWVEGVLNEYDWLTKDKQKICDELKEIQEKLRPLEDNYKNFLEQHKKDTDDAKETKHKIQILQDKIRRLYEMYKK